MFRLTNRYLAAGALTGFAAAASLSAAPAAAQQSNIVTPPPGCTAFLTVQSRSCTVSHMWTCEGDPEGTHWRMTMDQDGPFYLSFTDSEFRWLLSYELRSGAQNVLIEPEDDPASISELFATGTDSMVFSTIHESASGQRTQRDYTGFDRLTGETVVVDGHTLNRTEFSYEYDLGDGPRRVQGHQYVTEEWNVFFGGQEVTTLPNGESEEDDYSPMDFAEPGEPGFLSATPLYDCGEMMS
ncbi:hypothetical protein [Nioella nitratireducens]|uniref:hypothetical protein n=1 Tax=Nioella nitratireducens TaxID=1287720 RepID=UPI0008FCFD11|nr:hypothetical protein [Nioella nitratireducens]